jgi:flagellar motor switch protein FliM
MSQVLSQEEVNALLNGISGGEIETEQEEIPEDSAIQAYNLTNQDRIVRGRMPALEMTGEKFVRIFGITLSSLLRKVVDINTISVDIAKYGQFMKTMPVPTSMHVFKMEPLKGKALFILESQVVFALIDIIFGGSGQQNYKIEGRDFTSIENKLTKRVVLSALSDFEKVWKPIKNLTIVYIKSETNPQFAQIVAPTDIVVVMKFECDMGFFQGMMTFCIPYSTLAPIREILLGGYQTEGLEIDREWAERFKEQLIHSNVELIVELGRTELTGKEIISLKNGDVIPLDHCYTDDLDVYVEDILKFRGGPGIYKGNQAVEMSKFIIT